VTPSVLVIMGVSGSGKTTVAAELARSLGWPFRDADEFHPKANVEKMKSGVPLTDEDRWPWLEAIAAFIDAERSRGEHAIVTCSALKRAYRRIIVGDRSDVRIVYLKGDKVLIAKRLAARHGHFMPPSLLQSQFDALEEPGVEERPVTVSIAPAPEEIVRQILAELGLDKVPQTAQ
jgi:carbohydrate kinase (thermoresistant glucokinase family)